MARTLLVLLLSLIALPREALAKPHRAHKALRAQPKSLGSPDDGKLVGGRRLDSNAHIRSVGGHRYGLPELVGLIERGAAKVAKRFPGSVLTVGDLSRRGGGDVDGHRSHESGRDVDVGFYLLKAGKPFVASRFVTIQDDGTAAKLPSVRFDDARNWALVEAWLTDPGAQVLQIFVSRSVRKRLLDQAARVKAPAAVQRRATEVLFQPTRGLPHDNHFHVRIACPKGHGDCVNFGKAALHRNKPKGATTPRKAAPATPGAPNAKRAHVSDGPVDATPDTRHASLEDAAGDHEAPAQEHIRAGSAESSSKPQAAPPPGSILPP